jgi:hypothetical protein
MKKSGDFTGRHTADSTADKDGVLVTNYGAGAGCPPADKEGRRHYNGGIFCPGTKPKS